MLDRVVGVEAQRGESVKVTRFWVAGQVHPQEQQTLSDFDVPEQIPGESVLR